MGRDKSSLGTFSLEKRLGAGALACNQMEKLYPWGNTRILETLLSQRKESSKLKYLAARSSIVLLLFLVAMRKCQACFSCE